MTMKYYIKTISETWMVGYDIITNISKTKHKPNDEQKNIPTSGGLFCLFKSLLLLICLVARENQALLTPVFNNRLFGITFLIT